ncbi:MAG: NYN domain-containing protein [Halobacteria archaeon]
MFNWLFGPGDMALFVDGPNLMREEFNIRLEHLPPALEEVSGGTPNVSRVYLDNRAPPSLIEAVETNGMDPYVTSGDVDVKMAVDAAVFAEREYDLAIATRDSDFKPVLDKANELGSKTYVLAPDLDLSTALKSTADEVIYL